MANWSPLRDALASVDDQATFAWSDLDELVGGLPRSAYEHAAFWKGDRSGWPGFTTKHVNVGRSVTFVRRSKDRVAARRQESKVAPARPLAESGKVDVVLVGCVKRKLDHPAPAQDLYSSSLFQKERAYAEATGAPWFVLSAKHGLSAPTTVLEPYDLRLSTTPRGYRRTWGDRVVAQLTGAIGPLAGKVIEVHAGSAYVDPIRDQLRAMGAHVVEPLHGLTMGQRLSWYGHSTNSKSKMPSQPSPNVGDLVQQLGNDAGAQTPASVLASGGKGLRIPGLYSWWVDQEGARELTAGLGLPVARGLIYAGLAGATRSRSGRKSTNTLWGRIRGMHLGGRQEFSTFRLSLGSIVANARGEDEIDEANLTTWMHEHLRVVAIPVEDADALNGLETAVLRELAPPLNLDKMPRIAIRARLTELRRQHSRPRSN